MHELKGRRRSEIKETNREFKRDMEGQRDEMKIDAEDVSIARGTPEKLEAEGTLEGAEAVMEHIEQAEESATEEFNEHNLALDKIHREGERSGVVLDEQIKSDLSDKSKVAEDRAQMRREGAIDKFEQALQKLEEDTDFLREALEENRSDREQNKQEIARLQEIIRGGGG